MSDATPLQSRGVDFCFRFFFFVVVICIAHGKTMLVDKGADRNHDPRGFLCNGLFFGFWLHHFATAIAWANHGQP